MKNKKSIFYSLNTALCTISLCLLTQSCSSDKDSKELESKEKKTPVLVWEKIDSGKGINNGRYWGTNKSRNTEEDWEMYRAKVPGGWLIQLKSSQLGAYSNGSGGVGSGLTFVPDSNHEW